MHQHAQARGWQVECRPRCLPRQRSVHEPHRRQWAGTLAAGRGWPGIHGGGKLAGLQHHVEAGLALQGLGPAPFAPQTPSQPGSPGPRPGGERCHQTAIGHVAVKDDHGGVVETENLLQLEAQEVVPPAHIDPRIVVKGQVLHREAGGTDQGHGRGHRNDHGLDPGRQAAGHGQHPG